VKVLVGHSVAPDEKEEKADEEDPEEKETKDGEVLPDQWVGPDQLDHRVKLVWMERRDPWDLPVALDHVVVPDLKDLLELLD